MVCQNCGSNEADFHFNSNINGDIKELHLCSECASKLGGGNQYLFPQADYLNTILSDLLGASHKKAESTRQCPLCGATEQSIISTGKVGCAQCYDTFMDMLGPYIKRIHGNAVHCGKVPSSAGPEIKLRRDIERLKQELDQAVAAEEYENAAVIRDKIRQLEGGIRE